MGEYAWRRVSANHRQLLETDGGVRGRAGRRCSAWSTRDRDRAGPRRFTETGSAAGATVLIGVPPPRDGSHVAEDAGSGGGPGPPGRPTSQRGRHGAGPDRDAGRDGPPVLELSARVAARGDHGTDGMRPAERSKTRAIAELPSGDAPPAPSPPAAPQRGLHGAPTSPSLRQADPHPKPVASTPHQSESAPELAQVAALRPPGRALSLSTSDGWARHRRGGQGRAG